jgi:hypothetical protein
MKIGTGTCAAPASCYAACMLSSLTIHSTSIVIVTEYFRRNNVSAETQSEQG